MALKVKEVVSVKEFHIKHDEKAIRLETDYTKFDSLEQIMLLSGIHFIEKGKTDRLKLLLQT